jgi:hypothetical protein
MFSIYKKRASTRSVVSPLKNNNLPEVGRSGQKETPLNFYNFDAIKAVRSTVRTE